MFEGCSQTQSRVTKPAVRCATLTGDHALGWTNQEMQVGHQLSAQVVKLLWHHLHLAALAVYLTSAIRRKSFFMDDRSRNLLNNQRINVNQPISWAARVNLLEACCVRQAADCQAALSYSA
jgi:hypothetical protein